MGVAGTNRSAVVAGRGPTEKIPVRNKGIVIPKDVGLVKREDDFLKRGASLVNSEDDVIKGEVHLAQKDAALLPGRRAS